MNEAAWEAAGWKIYHLPGLDPIPWKAPNAYIGKKGGGTFIGHYPADECEGFKEAVREDFHVHNPNGTIRTGEVEIRFWLWRNTAGHNEADATNCQKLLEDALQDILYRNDRQVKDIRTVWVEQSPTTEPYIMIAIRERRGLFHDHPNQRRFAPPVGPIAGEHLAGEDVDF